MRLLNRFNLGLVAVLIALLTTVGGLVISQAVGGQNGVAVKALNYDDRVRFVLPI